MKVRIFLYMYIVWVLAPWYTYLDTGLSVYVRVYTGVIICSLRRKAYRPMPDSVSTGKVVCACMSVGVCMCNSLCIYMYMIICVGV